MKASTNVKVDQVNVGLKRIFHAVLADFRAKNLKWMRPFDLRYLGYQFHDTPRMVLEKDIELRMVIDEDTKREVDFSFVLYTKTNQGKVLPHSFTLPDILAMIWGRIYGLRQWFSPGLRGFRVFAPPVS